MEAKTALRISCRGAINYTLHRGLDVQVRGGGGIAERLHASCRHVDAVAEDEERERRQAAHCSLPSSSDTTAGKRSTSMPTASSVVCHLSTSRLTGASYTALLPAHTSRTVAEV
jgi:hypothetical protein